MYFYRSVRGAGTGGAIAPSIFLRIGEIAFVRALCTRSAKMQVHSECRSTQGAGAPPIPTPLTVSQTLQRNFKLVLYVCMYVFALS